MYAFPVDQNSPEDGLVQSPGMTLLDYFAGQALTAIILKAQPGSTLGTMVADAFNIAKVMVNYER